mmetsp:Transcript_48748/g.115824  ORF Transcript_48748/g.115824 Transcript_48748/m.115824 type:complete len:244 (-) Transcript_48748:33-764(-)
MAVLPVHEPATSVQEAQAAFLEVEGFSVKNTFIEVPSSPVAVARRVRSLPAGFRSRGASSQSVSQQRPLLPAAVPRTQSSPLPYTRRNSSDEEDSGADTPNPAVEALARIVARECKFLQIQRHETQDAPASNRRRKGAAKTILRFFITGVHCPANNKGAWRLALFKAILPVLTCVGLELTLHEKQGLVVHTESGLSVQLMFVAERNTAASGQGSCTATTVGECATDLGSPSVLKSDGFDEDLF